jgi:hypothetical protein
VSGVTMIDDRVRHSRHGRAGYALAALGAALFPPTSAAYAGPRQADLPGPPSADGSAIVPDRERHDNQRAQRVMAGFADCLANPWRADLTSFLSRFPGSPAASAEVHRLTSSFCLDTDFATLTFSVDLLRGALFNLLYRRNFGAAPMVDVKAVAPIDYTLGSITAEPRRAAWHIVRWNYADCVVRATPDDARALVLSEVAGEGETQAFRALRPELARCMPAGADWHFTRPILRGLIAETLYRLSAAKTGMPPFGGTR